MSPSDASLPSDASMNVALMRPLLPPAEAVLPYLKEIDQNRWYSNFGPLVMRLEERIAQMFGVENGQACSIANATAGMTAVLRALDVPRGSFCLVPSWTFVATPAAARAVGMEPVFLDVDPESWALRPDQVRHYLYDLPGVVGAVIVVAPFGAPLPIAEWEAFSAETAIPVIIDAAAAFDALGRSPHFHASRLPTVVSMHATKACGSGEGGFMLCRDKALVKRTLELTNFGFYTRTITVPGTNGKLSEYGAAVALAALDDWPAKRDRWLSLRDRVETVLAPLHQRFDTRLWGAGEDWVASTCNFILPDRRADEAIAQLNVRGIKSRQWWNKGCHRQPAYAHARRQALPVTEQLGESVLALPYSIDLSEAELAYVAEQLQQVLQRMYG